GHFSSQGKSNFASSLSSLWHSGPRHIEQGYSEQIAGGLYLPEVPGYRHSKPYGWTSRYQISIFEGCNRQLSTHVSLHFLHWSIQPCIPRLKVHQQVLKKSIA